MDESVMESVAIAIQKGFFFQQIQTCDLPIFMHEYKGHTLFYTPGLLIAASPDQASQLIFDLHNPNPRSVYARQIRQKAEMAVSQFDLQHRISTFTPYCLTLYTSTDCNLDCSYCYSGSKEHKSSVNLDLIAIRKGAGFVAEKCKNASLPMSVVFHGGGEPLIDPRLPKIWNCIHEIADIYNVKISSYIATNGVVSEKAAKWAAAHIDQIGLSCDGYPDIQNRQRSGRNGDQTSPMIERTARILHDEKKKIIIRATITKESCSQIPEIVRYFCDTLHADEIHLEPAFDGLDSERVNGFSIRDAEYFCCQFVKGNELAVKKGATVEFSGSRLNEIHGRYCQIFRHVLQIVPGGGISTCFKTIDRNTAKNEGRLMGDIHDSDVNLPWLSEISTKLSMDDPACHYCFNRFHCSRGCPDICPLAGSEDYGSFRCRINKIMTGYSLLKFTDDFLLPMISEHEIIGMEIH